MSGRGQALTRSRCPACGTVFRVTSEQLRLKAGKVRCGHCQSVFNAFDHLQHEESPALTPAPVVALAEHRAPVLPADPLPAEPPAAPPTVDPLTPVADPSAPAGESTPAELPDDDAAGEAAQLVSTSAPAPEPEPLAESPEQTTQAAREAGLVAVRDLTDSNVYNRWSAGALTSDGFGGFDETQPKSPLWPYLLVILLLLLLLAGQLAFHYRTELLTRVPAAASLYAALAIDVPLPREAALVAIESSDLQADTGRGLFVLNATLKNRAAYAQAWPSLELTLTDINDRVVARRRIEADDYLAPGDPPASFAAHGETAVRLWIEAPDLGAAGYRLYIFYP